MPSPDERTLHVPPTPESLRWVEAAIGPGARALSVRRLRGGVSSAVHALVVEREAEIQHLVLRRFVRADWFAREPEIAQREAAALRLLEGTDVPAPHLIAVDEDGSASGVPSVLMTRLRGHIVLAPPDIDSWLRQIAEALPRIHGTRPSVDEMPWTYKPYNDVTSLDVPTWSARPAEWARALDVARGPSPPAAEHIIHRDYHPANILWSSGRITGIVDWVNACRGPAGMDIGHCRRNLALSHGIQAADRFLDYCLGWAAYHPYWDIMTLTDWLPSGDTYDGWTDLGLDVPVRTVRARADEYVASLVGRL